MTCVQHQLATIAEAVQVFNSRNSIYLQQVTKQQEHGRPLRAATPSPLYAIMNDPKIRMIKVRHSDGAYETVAAEQVGQNTYMLLESPTLTCKVNYGDTVSVQPDVNGELEMIKIVRRSDYKSRRFLLPKLSKSELMEKLGIPIKDAGGFWEVDMGGIIIVHMPLASVYDLDALFNNLGSSSVEIKDDAETGV